MNIQYQYPQAFYLLGLIPVMILLYVFYRSWRSANIKKIGDEKLLKNLITSSTKKSLLKFIFILLAFSAGVITLANPRKPDNASSDLRKGIDIVIALDVSNSMLATDLPPDRMTRAKNFISRLVDKVTDDRLSLVVFAGNAYVQMPLTFDRGAAKMYVAAAGPEAVSAQGTSFSEALTRAEAAFGEESERFRSVILISDGETHDDGALEKIQELAAKGIMVNTIGIGSPEGSAIPDPQTGQPKTDESGQAVISKLNDEILRQMAAATNGVYIHLNTAETAVSTIMAQFADIEKKALADTSLLTYKTFYAWIAVPMLLLLILDVFISDRKKRA